MILEHVLYNLAVAIIVGIVYQQYTGRNPTWLIVAAAYLSDIDYILQFIWYTIYDNTGIILPITVRHGDFHNILSIVVLTLLFAWVYKKYLHGIFMDGVICIGIGGFLHYICDIMVYDNIYHPFYPFKYSMYTWNLIPETRNLMDIGDTRIMFIGICLVIFCIMIKFAIEGEDRFIHYIENHIKPLPSICISIIVNTLEL